MKTFRGITYSTKTSTTLQHEQLPNDSYDKRAPEQLLNQL